MANGGVLGMWELPKVAKTSRYVVVKAPVIGSTLRVSRLEGKRTDRVGDLAVPTVQHPHHELAFSFDATQVVVLATYAGKLRRRGFEVDVFRDGLSLRDGGSLEAARQAPKVPRWAEDPDGRPTLTLRRRAWTFLASERPYILMGLLLCLVPFWAISGDRAQRSASAPAVLEQVRHLSNGRAFVGDFSFSVDGVTYRGQDVRGPNLGKGRTWDATEIATMHVCYDPARPGTEFALTPGHYRCGDPDFWTTDGGW